MISYYLPSKIKSKIFTICLAVVTCLLSGCLTSSLSINPKLNTAAHWTKNTLTIEKKHAVSVELLTSVVSKKIDKLPSFYIRFKNKGNKSVLFKPSAVKAYSGNIQINIYTAVELTKLVEKEYKTKSDAYSGQQAEIILGSGATQNDPSSALVRIEHAKRANSVAVFQQTREKQLNEIAMMIIPLNVSPDDFAQGIIKLHTEEIKPNEPLKIVITIDNDNYEFFFDAK